MSVGFIRRCAAGLGARSAGVERGSAPPCANPPFYLWAAKRQNAIPLDFRQLLL